MTVGEILAHVLVFVAGMVTPSAFRKIRSLKSLECNTPFTHQYRALSDGMFGREEICTRCKRKRWVSYT